MGLVVGSSGEEPSGSTVIPTARAVVGVAVEQLAVIGVTRHYPGGDHVGAVLVPELVDRALGRGRPCPR